MCPTIASCDMWATKNIYVSEFHNIIVFRKLRKPLLDLNHSSSYFRYNVESIESIFWGPLAIELENNASAGFYVDAIYSNANGTDH